MMEFSYYLSPHDENILTLSNETSRFGPENQDVVTGGHKLTCWQNCVTLPVSLVLLLR